MTLKRLAALPLLSLCLLLYACPPPEDDELDDFTSTVYNEESFVELSLLNGNSVNNVLFTDGVTSGNNVVDASVFGSSNLFSFETGIAAPTDNTVSIQAGLDSAIITLENGSQVPPFFADSNVGSIIDAGDGILRQDFRYSFSYPPDAPAIPIDIISSIVLIYTLDYSSGGELIHSKTFTHTVIFN